MCRYSDRPYKSSYACVACRRAFKRMAPGLGKGWPSQAPSAPCPECGGDAVRMGRDFHAPARSDRRQWRKIELLVADGVRFDSCGCSGPGPRPATLPEAREYVTRRRALRERHLMGGRIPVGEKLAAGLWLPTRSRA